MIICSLQALYSDHFWYCSLGTGSLKNPHSVMVEVLWEVRETPPNTLPTSQSNGHALGCNSDSGPRTASPHQKGMLSFPAATPMILCTHSTSWVLFFPLYLLCNLLIRNPSNNFLFQFYVDAAGPCWRQMAEVLRCHSSNVSSQFHQDV